MEAILKFNLPDEQDEFEMTRKAGSMASAAWEVSNFLRSIRKYEDLATEAEQKLFERIDSKFHEEFSELL